MATSRSRDHHRDTENREWDGVRHRLLLLRLQVKKLVIDIETVGTPWEEHDSYVREYLIKGMSEAEAEEEKRRGALSPFTGRIVAIGVMNAETKKSCAMYEVPDQKDLVVRREGLRTLISG